MREIPLSQGYVALVDDEDYERVVAAGKWSVLINRRRDRTVKNMYAYRTQNRTSLLLHRFLTDAPKGLQVDHLNGDSLDNRRANLRVVTNQQNSRNARLKVNNTSGFAGVCWDKSMRRWKAQIRTDKNRYLGAADTAEEAARVYDTAAREAGFKTFNFPEIGERSVVTGEVREN